jgi:adenosylhomocysteine nucleosidase
MTIIAVSGLVREARIARGPGVKTVVSGANVVLLRQRLEQAIGEGADGIISIGVAGALAPSLKPGDCVVATKVLEEGGRFVSDGPWTARLAAALPNAILGPLAGTDTIIAGVPAKIALLRSTGACAVDMESHIVARLANAHGLPFVVLRTIADPANNALPALASVAITDEGRIDYLSIFKSLLGDPGQIPDLIQTSRESKVAFRALLRCRRALGLRLLGPDGGKLALDMR